MLTYVHKSTQTLGLLSCSLTLNPPAHFGESYATLVPQVEAAMPPPNIMHIVILPSLGPNPERFPEHTCTYIA